MSLAKQPEIIHDGPFDESMVGFDRVCINIKCVLCPYCAILSSLFSFACIDRLACQAWKELFSKEGACCAKFNVRRILQRASPGPFVTLLLLKLISHCSTLKGIAKGHDRYCKVSLVFALWPPFIPLLPGLSRIRMRLILFVFLLLARPAYQHLPGVLGGQDCLLGSNKGT